MFRKTSNTYQLKKDGQIKFNTLDRVHGLNERSESAWEHGIVSLLLLAVCGVGDAALFYQLFWASLYGSTLILMISVVAMLIGFDVAPIYFGHTMKKRHQREVVAKQCPELVNSVLTKCLKEKVAEYILGVAMGVAFAANILVRLSLRDILFEDYGSYGNDGNSTRALVFAIFFIALPVITSLVSFSVSYIISNPLKSSWLKSQRETYLLEEEHIDYATTLKEYELLPNYIERLDTTDKALYEAELSKVDTIAQQYRDHVRLFIAELSGDPASTNLVTRDVTPKPTLSHFTNNSPDVVISTVPSIDKEVA